MRFMMRLLLFAFLIFVSAISFYIAYGLDQSILNQVFPIKNESVRKKLFATGGSILLLCALLSLYAAIVSPR
jgi:hypothetical protein